MTFTMKVNLLFTTEVNIDYITSAQLHDWNTTNATSTIKDIMSTRIWYCPIWTVIGNCSIKWYFSSNFTSHNLATDHPLINNKAGIFIIHKSFTDIFMMSHFNLIRKRNAILHDKYDKSMSAIAIRYSKCLMGMFNV